MSATVGLLPAARSEVLRWRRSSAGRLPLLGAAFGIVDIALLLASASTRSWAGVLAYQNMWVVLLGPLGAALVVVSACYLDRNARGGGTWWRPVQPLTARISRFLALALIVLALNAAAVITPVALASVFSTSTPPWGRVTQLVLVLWLSQLSLVALLLRAGSQWGRLSVLAVAAGWTLMGIILGESPAWRVLPPTWLVRGALPLIGTHVNGVALEPGAALLTASPWPPVLLSVALALLILLVPGHRSTGGRATRLAAPASDQRGNAPTVAPHHEALPDELRPLQHGEATPRVAAAVLLPVSRTSLRWLIPLAVLLSVTVLRWRTAQDVFAVYALLVLPTAATLAPIILWSAVGDGWRAVASRATGTTGPAWVVIAAAVTSVTAVSAAVVAICYLAGLPSGLALRGLLACLATGALLTCLSLWVTVGAGAITTLALGMAGTILGALIGGTPLQERMWFAAPWSWASYTSPARLLLIIPASALLTALLCWAAIHSCRKAAATQ